MASKSQAQISRLALSVLISLQVSLEPVMSHAGTDPGMIASHGASQVSKANGEMDPVWEEFTANNGADFKIKFDAQDPALDKDPFFMRSQAWVNGTSTSSLSFAKKNGGLEIAIPHANKNLRLNLPLTPIHATDEFVFLSLDKSSDLFRKAAGAKEAPGEGIFFLSRTDLLEQSLDGKPAPLFFFPLSGQGWTGTLTSMEMPQADSLVIANQSESVALELKDVETVMKAQQINMMLATSLSFKNRNGAGGLVYPASGMTAAFGLFFTGIDSEMPEKSLWFGADSASYFMEHPAFTQLLNKVTRFLPLSVNQAQAFELSPDVVSRLVFVGSVLTGMLAVSVVLKYAHPGIRKKIASLRAQEGKPRGVLKLAAREVKETFDVFAAVTTTSAQFASVNFANALEIFLDRFAPSVAAADHTLVRRFLKNSYYFSRNSVKGVPVNAKTFFLGALVMGTVDTAMVVVQYVAAVPWIAKTLSPYASEDMQARIERTFDPNNPNTKQIVVQDSVRNGLAYLQIGAASYSMDSRAQVIESVTKDIENSMKAKGLDPADPSNQAQKQRLIEEKINIAMKQRGLPGSEQFLFDANTLFSKVPKALGYDTTEEMQTQESFILASRFGLTKNALAKAILNAKAWANVENSPAAREAVQILEETSASMSFLKNGIKAARQARQQLTILSYEGPVEYAVRYIPDAWSAKYSPEAAQAAGLIFRQSLYSFLKKEGDNLVMSNAQDVKTYAEQAKLNALEGLKKDHPELGAATGAALESKMDDKLRYELNLRTQVEINTLARAKESNDKADNFTLPKQDWLAKRQQKRAEQEANGRLQIYLRTLGTEAQVSPQQIAAWKNAYYARALAKQVGLYVEDKEVAAEIGRKDYADMMAHIEKTAEEITDSEIKNDVNMSRLFAKSTPVEQEKIRMNLYANNFLQAYKEATTEMEMVSPTDPAQPGKFQKIRQTLIVRNSAFLTRSLRVLESFTDDQALKTGWGPAFARNVPLYSDLWSAHRRLLKTILPSLSVSYMWNYFAWQVHMPYASMVLLVATSAATISTPSQWINRAFRQNGIKAMDGMWSKIAYGLPYAWVTFIGMFPIMMYSSDVAKFFSDYIRDPMMSTFGQITLKEWLASAAVAGLITAGTKMGLREKLSDKVKAVKEMVRGASKVANSCDETLSK